MSNKRRDFIKQAAAGLAITAISGQLPGCSSSAQAGATGNLKNFGLQLYTLRDAMPADPKGVLKQVSGMGYKQVESFEGAKGMFWGMTNTEFKKYMDDLGMQIVSSHCDINKDFDRKAAEAAEIGMKYLIAPSLPNEAGMNKDDYKKAADVFNERGQTCKSKGIRFAFHNHDQAFTTRESGFVAEDVLMQNTDPALVDFEMDIYWVVTAGADPITWLEKYPNRFRLCHIKDRKKHAPLADHDASCVAGTGAIDFPKILNVGKKNGLEYYIVEQEHYDNMTPVQAAKENADYLKKIKI